MYKSKKAQISDTISWMVATIIIVLILGVPIFLVQAKMINLDRVNFERVQDPIATKAISGYLFRESSYILADLKSGQLSSETDTETKKRLSRFLYSLSRNENIEGWNLLIFIPPKESSSLWNQLFSSDKELYTQITYDVWLKEGVFSNLFYIRDDSNGEFLIFKFWKDMQGR
jgi:CHASE1-domain containing sensor protein